MLRSLAHNRSLAPFSSGGYRLVWASTLQFWVARMMEVTVLGWLVLKLTDSSLQVALVGFFNVAPQAPLAIIAGALSDRISRRLILISAASMTAAAAVGIALLVVLDAVQPWHVFLAAVVEGIAWTMDFPTRKAYIGDVLPSSQAATGVNLDFAGIMISSVLGPIIGGGLIAVAGVGGACLAIAALYATHLVTLLFLPGFPFRRGARASVIQDIVEGAKFSRRVPVIAGVLVMTVMMNIFVFPITRIIPVFTTEVLHVGPGLLGLMVGAQGVGAVTATLVLTALPFGASVRVFTGGCLLAIMLYLAFSLSTSYPISFIFYLFSGFGNAAFGTLQVSLLLRETTALMRGRVFGMLTLAIGSFVLGSLLLGVLSEELGAPKAATFMLLTAGLLILGAAAVNPAMRRDPAQSGPRLPRAG